MERVKSSPGPVRLVAAAAVLLLLPGAAGAEEPSPPPLTRPVAGVAAEEESRSLGIGLEHLLLEHHASFESRLSVDLDFEREMRLALWNHPDGRLAWTMASELSMVGRTGMVHGGHMLGVGPGTTAIGDRRSPTTRLLHGERSWRELSTPEKVQVGADTAVVIGFLWALLQAFQ